MTVQNLFLGFGGTGAHILTYVKELAVQKYGSRPDHLEFLEFDTIADWKPGETVKITGDAGAEERIARGEEVSLDPASEYFHLKDAAVSFKTMCEKDLANPQIRAKEYPHLAEWLHSDWLKQHLPSAALNLTRGAAQQRQIGRYAMFANAQAIVSELSRRLQRMQERAGPDNVNVWIVGSAAGGTGAGCMIDAAYLTHLAGEQVQKKPIITGVVVLPEVYTDVFDEPRKREASLARSYSFFRELDRVQFPLGAGESYYVGNGVIASEVRYDRNGSLHAHVPSKLFDYRVYLSQRCNDDADRTRFFSSVANALDAFVDRNVGAKLLQDQNNDSGAPIGFGAARLVLPKDTYAERFAWRQVDRYLRALTTPEYGEGGTVLTGFASGADSDRRNAASNAVRGLLPLFNDLLEIAGKGPEERAAFARSSLTPRRIVEGWFQMAVANAAQLGVAESELRSLPVLLYCNPLQSLEVGADEVVQVKDLRLRTHGENQKAKGVKEDQKSSGERFARELREIRNEYRSADGGAGSFEKGLRFVRTVNERRLRQAVDNWVMSSLRPGLSVAADTDKPSEGTVLTRLYREISLLVDGGGALKQVADLIDEFAEGIKTQLRSERLEQNANDAVLELERAKRSGMFQMSWIEAPQTLAREETLNYLQGEQKQHLVEEMRRLTQIVGSRLAAWREEIGNTVMKELVRGVPEENRPSALNVIRRRINDLSRRLDRITRNGSLLMSVSDPFDTTMDGYEGYLENIATVRDGRQLHEHLLTSTAWSVSTGGKNAEPAISLNVTGLAESGADGSRDLHQRLYAKIRPEVDQMLRGIDVFDYLVYVRKKEGGDPRAVIGKLKERLHVLLTVVGATRLPTVKLLYRGAGGAGTDKDTVARLLGAELNEQKGAMILRDSINNHSDPDSITLFSVVDPDGYDSRIHDVESCATEYLKGYVGFSGDEALRALTNHAFRAEEESWFIERKSVVEKGVALQKEDLVPPRIARLLDQPAMMRAFVHCLATGAIFRSDDGTDQWFYRPRASQPIPLGDSGDNLLQVAVIFVLQQRSGVHDLRRFTPETAVEAAQEAAKSAPVPAGEAAATYPGVLKAAAADKRLSLYVERYFRDQVLGGAGGSTGDKNADRIRHETSILQQIFEFYLPFGSQTNLSKRAISAS